MRVLLQNTETKLYYIDSNEWTDSPEKATDFQEVEHAAQVYHSRDIAYAQIIVDSWSSSVPQHMIVDVVRELQIPG